MPQIISDQDLRDLYNELVKGFLVKGPLHLPHANVVNGLYKRIKEAIDNIRDDRDITSTLLTQVFAEITNGQETHKELGLIAAKYVETLQRSNEQLVKLTSIMAKKTDTSVELSEEDKKSLFDVIQGEK